jgi:hypothetical protein
LRLKEFFDMPLSLNMALGDIKPIKLQEQVRKIHSRYPPIEVVVEDPHLEKKLFEFERRLANNNWAKYKWRNASGLARGFLCSELVDDPRWQNIKSVLLKSLTDSPKRSFAKACFESYLVTFKEGSSLTKELSEALRGLEPEMLASMSEFVEGFDALKPIGLVNRIGQFLSQQDEPFAAMKNIGVSSPHMPGLIAQGFISNLEYLEPELRRFETSAFIKVFDWLNPEEEPISPLGKIPGIEAMLAPFINGSGPDELIDEITNFLFETYGDPRISRTKWAGVSDPYIHLVFGWLTKKSLKAFFEIISKFEGSHMWEARRKFWTDIFDSGRISNAWVVLNREGIAFARELARETDDKSYLSFGRLSNSNESTCYFIMQIGRTIIVEGSHSFALRFFAEQNKSRPKMFSPNYYKPDLLSNLADEIYRHDPQGNWRQKALNAMRMYE